MEGKDNIFFKGVGGGGDGFTPAMCLIKMSVDADMTIKRLHSSFVPKKARSKRCDN